MFYAVALYVDGLVSILIQTQHFCCAAYNVSVYRKSAWMYAGREWNL